MKFFLKAQTFKMAQSDILFAKSGAGHDAAIRNWLRPFLAEIWALPCPKNALQNAPKNLSL